MTVEYRFRDVPCGYVGRPTTDGRVIAALALERSHNVPVFDNAMQVGWASVRMEPRPPSAEVAIIADATISRPCRGALVPSLDLTARFALTPEDEVFASLSGTLRALIVEPNPAWPDLPQIEVTA